VSDEPTAGLLPGGEPDRLGPATDVRPAFYAARSGRLADWWTLLHPPYTAWHLAYVVIGACLAVRVNVTTLLATLLAFFLAVGLSAHALDELHGRPLRTRIPTAALVTAAVVGLAGALALGIVGVARIGWPLVPFLIVGPLLVVSYNFELLGGFAHNEVGFAASWGAFPVLTAYVAQTGKLNAAACVAALGAFALSAAQRRLSLPARRLRRRVVRVAGTATLSDGSTESVEAAELLAPLEGALRALTWTVVLLALALALDKLA